MCLSTVNASAIASEQKTCGFCADENGKAYLGKHNRHCGNCYNDKRRPTAAHDRVELVESLQLGICEAVLSHKLLQMYRPSVHPRHTFTCSGHPLD